MSDKNLNGPVDLMGGPVGNVDLWGVDEFGAIAGMDPRWGVLIGGGTSFAVSLAARKMADPGTFMRRNADAIGFGAGVATAAAMFAMEGTRAAATGALAGAFLVSGIRQLEKWLTGSDSLGMAVANQLNGFGKAVPEQLNGAGFGMAVANQLNGIPTAGATTGNGPPVNLMGPALPASAAQAQAVQGMPALSGLGQSYGATIFGGSN